MAARTGAAGLGGGSVWPSGQPEIIVVMFDLISEGLAKHLVMPMGGHNVGVLSKWQKWQKWGVGGPSATNVAVGAMALVGLPHGPPPPAN